MSKPDPRRNTFIGDDLPDYPNFNSSWQNDQQQFPRRTETLGRESNYSYDRSQQDALNDKIKRSSTLDNQYHGFNDMQKYDNIYQFPASSGRDNKKQTQLEPVYNQQQLSYHSSPSVMTQPIYQQPPPSQNFQPPYQQPAAASPANNRIPNNSNAQSQQTEYQQQSGSIAFKPPGNMMSPPQMSRTQNSSQSATTRTGKKHKSIDEEIAALRAKEQRYQDEIHRMEADSIAQAERKELLHKFIRDLNESHQRILVSQEQYNILNRVRVFSDFNLVVRRYQQIEQLTSLDLLQQSAIEHMRKKIEEEKDGLLQAMHDLNEAKKYLDRLQIEEERLFIDLIEFNEKKREVETKGKDMHVANEMENYKSLVEAEIKRQVKLKKKLAEKKVFIQEKVLDGLGKTVMQLLGLLMNYLMHLTNEKAEVKKKLDKQFENERRKEQQQNAPTDLEKTKPEWDDPLFKWPIVCRMLILSWPVPKRHENGLSSLTTARNLEEINVREEQVEEIIKMMKKPFAEGSYRLAMYGISDKGIRYSIKQFKFSMGPETDMEYARKQCWYHTFCAIVADYFNDALIAAGLQYSVQFVNSHVGRRADTQGIYMLEPLLKGFAKWTNNVDYIARTHEGEMMAAFTHWTYIRSLASFMVADLQGYVELSSKKSVIRNFVADNNSPNSTKQSVVSTDGSQERAIRSDGSVGGDGPFIDRYKFTLTDPAILFLTREGDCGVLDQIHSDEAGDMGEEGKDLFFSAHKCGDICAALGIQHGA